MNVFAQLTRNVKVPKLVAAIDEVLPRLPNHPIDPHNDPAAAVDALRYLDDEWWGIVAEVAEVNPPSDITRQQVIDVYLNRADRPTPADPFIGL